MDDDLTLRLKTRDLPLDTQLMLVPMWTLRSDYHDCMRPLDKVMESYMNFRKELVKIDEHMDSGTASGSEVTSAFTKIMGLLNVYSENQKVLNRILKRGHHQLMLYARASQAEAMWEEMMRLKEIDYASYTRMTCCFEHVIMSLFQLVESVRSSIQTSQDISRCCAAYLIKMTKKFKINLPGEEAPFVPFDLGEVDENERDSSSDTIKTDVTVKSGEASEIIQANEVGEASNVYS